MFIHALLPRLVDRCRGKHERRLQQTTQLRRLWQPGRGQRHAVLGNPAVQACDIGGVVSGFHTVKTAILPPPVIILLGSNHGAVISTQALEQLPVIGRRGAGRQQQTCRYQKPAMLHDITRVVEKPVAMLIRMAVI